MFPNRQEAGKLLAEKLIKYKKDSPIILALPRGGVVVAKEVAKALNARLDVIVSRKIGYPGNPEFGIGAISENGIFILDTQSISTLGISSETINQIRKKEEEEMNRRIKLYRNKPFPYLNDKTVIIIDDGLVTGITAQAAIQTIKKHHPKKLIFATPVCASDSMEKIRPLVNQIICLSCRDDFGALSMYYRDFQQVSNEEVIALLNQTNIL
jgi:predicted phosphoribosyltransferase